MTISAYCGNADDRRRDDLFVGCISLRCLSHLSFLVTGEVLRRLTSESPRNPGKNKTN